MRPAPGQEAAAGPYQRAQQAQQAQRAQQQQQQDQAWASAPHPTSLPQQPSPPQPPLGVQEMRQQLRGSQPISGSWASGALPATTSTLDQQLQFSQQQPPMQQNQPLQQMGRGEGAEGQQAHPLTVPVSAVAAGLAPDRSGTAPTGSGEA
jgi:hypothetical protein